MEYLNTPDDIDDFYDEVDSLEDKILFEFERDDTDVRVALLSMLRIAATVHYDMDGEEEDFAKLARAVWIERKSVRDLLDEKEDD